MDIRSTKLLGELSLIKDGSFSSAVSRFLTFSPSSTFCSALLSDSDVTCAGFFFRSDSNNLVWEPCFHRLPPPSRTVTRIPCNEKLFRVVLSSAPFSSLPSITSSFSLIALVVSSTCSSKKGLLEKSESVRRVGRGKSCSSSLSGCVCLTREDSVCSTLLVVVETLSGLSFVSAK